ncbi:hypothetical protein FHK02_1710 [Spirosoma sp. LMG 31448]|uniref:Uncharacterized protein n=1 Tax=Spirosoma utsteinense TaxID=2585773 RepID=A0ABR6WBM8_9BACT|nr:hypothetical protein [Spirosoma utsteinense]MBC3793937.1 hypothetical protein [Spirosoma utsteinense]
MQNLQHKTLIYYLCIVKLIERGHTPVLLTFASANCFSHCRMSKLADVPSCLGGGDKG